MRLRDVLVLYDYNCWARDHVHAIIRDLDGERLNAPAPLSYGSILAALTHILNAEWLWRVRCQERVSPPTVRFEEPLDSLQELERVWREEEAAMRAYLDDLEDDRLHEPISYRAIRGQSYENALWQILVHLVYHGTHHRSELASHLAVLGHTPGNFDFIVYLRESET